MPIRKIKLEHKFGIVSVTHKEELDRRAQAKKCLNKRGTASGPQPKEESDKEFNVTEDFVLQFNESSDNEKMELEVEARQYLHRTQRRIGIRSGGVGDHVDLSVGWKQLILLALCDCRMLQEEVLETLYVSLYISPISRSHAEPLLEVAGHIVSWLQAVAFAQPFLRTGEIKLLKVAQLLFLRLFYHQVASDFKEYQSQKFALGQSLEVFLGQIEIYKPFPSVSFALRFIGKVGRYLSCGFKPADHDAQSHLGSNSASKERLPDADLLPPASNVEGSDAVLKGTQEGVDIGIVKEELVVQQHGPCNETQQARDKDEQGRPLTLHGTARPGNLTDESEARISPLLWLSLKLWRNVSHTRKGIQKALEELVAFNEERREKHWLHDTLSIMVFAESATINECVMEALLTYAMQRVPYAQSLKRQAPTLKRHSLNFLQQWPSAFPASASNTATTFSSIRRLHAFMTRSSVSPTSDITVQEFEDSSSGADSIVIKELQQCLFDQNKAESGSLEAGMCEPKLDGPVCLWGPHQVLAYTHCLGKLCVRGKSSTIRQMALQGNAIAPLGLIQLLNLFFSGTEKGDDCEPEFSWQVRHMAVIELVKVVNWYRSDTQNEGMKNAAWNALLEHRRLERDNRVLEAIKISQVEAEMERSQSLRQCCHGPSLYTRLSTNLAIIFLPPLRLVSVLRTPGLPTSHKMVSHPHRKKSPEERTRLPRLTVGDEITLNTAMKATSLPKDQAQWTLVQNVAKEHFEREALEDERLRQIERERALNSQMAKLRAEIPSKPLRQRVK